MNLEAKALGPKHSKETGTVQEDMYDCIAPRVDLTKGEGRDATGVSEETIGSLSNAATRVEWENQKSMNH